MTGPLSDDKLMEILKDVYRTAAASPDFKEQLRRRLNEEATAYRTPAPKPFWRQPFVWGPAAAALAVAVVLVIVLVVVPTLSPSTLGTLEVRVTDAKDKPVVTAIKVTFDNVSVHRAGDEGDSEGEWIVLAENLGKTIDLLQLNDIEELLSKDEIKAGHYTQIRVGVVKVAVTINDTSQDVGLEPTGDGEISSGGLKLVHSFYVKADETTIITIDFDLGADKSLVFANGKWIFKPTIRLNVALPSE